MFSTVQSSFLFVGGRKLSFHGSRMWDYVEVLRDVRVVVMIFQPPGCSFAVFVLCCQYRTFFRLFVYVICVHIYVHTII